MTQKSKSLLEIHLAVFLFGVSGLFPKLIHLPPIIITAARVIIAAIALRLVLFYSKKTPQIRAKKDYFIFMITGLLYALNAVSFYEAIQLSTVAVGVLSATTFPIFATLLEPLYFKEKFRGFDLLLALVTFGGVFLIVPKFNLHSHMTQGVCWGIITGLSFANFSIINRKYVQHYSSLVMVFYQDIVAAIVLFPAFFFLKVRFSLEEILLLILLGIVFTAGSHSLFVKGLRHVKAQTAGIITNVEPLYAALFALFILKEIPTVRTILGGIMIIAATSYATLSSHRAVSDIPGG